MHKACCLKCKGVLYDADSLWASSWGERFQDVEKIDEEPKIREITTGLTCASCGAWIEVITITRPDIPPGDTRPKNLGPATGDTSRRKVEAIFNETKRRMADGVKMKFVATEIGMNYATFYSHYKAIEKARTQK